jgi:hypothetical protein
MNKSSKRDGWNVAKTTVIGKLGKRRGEQELITHVNTAFAAECSSDAP